MIIEMLQVTDCKMTVWVHLQIKFYTNNKENSVHFTILNAVIIIIIIVMFHKFSPTLQILQKKKTKFFIFSMNVSKINSFDQSAEWLKSSE